VNRKSSKKQNFSKYFLIDHKGSGAVGAGAIGAGPIETVLHRVMALALPK
jgi:hypothetical protein